MERERRAQERGERQETSPRAGHTLREGGNGGGEVLPAW